MLMPWIILRIQSRLEQHAEDAIKGRGYEVYCPRVKVTRLPKIGRRNGLNRHKTKHPPETEVKPLYSGYLFVRDWLELGVIGMLQDDHGIRLRGVLSTVKFGDCLAMVSDELIDSIKERVDSGILDAYEGVSYRPHYKIGQKLRWTAGPLAGNECVVESVDNPNKIRVSMNVMGANRAIVVTKLSELEALL
jgi:transcription antitermination factor NusG